jgi:RNA polymerase subunit RPABC4/transcription elongation factor Spt4|uniref:NINE protein n=1 Tax=candidate division WOR-3 bacterium TaxID=2052148 RepID=A0A7V6CN81_UNCW3
MYCRNCGKEISEVAEICIHCGARPLKGRKYCQNCGSEVNPEAEICIKCGARLLTEKRKIKEEGQKDWLVALLLSIFLGNLGIDRFYLGYIGLGILKLLTFGGFGIWWLIDLILIATNRMKDAEGRELYKSV